jgi:hypothetical protein
MMHKSSMCAFSIAISRNYGSPYVWPSYILQVNPMIVLKVLKARRMVGQFYG